MSAILDYSVPRRINAHSKPASLSDIVILSVAKDPVPAENSCGLERYFQQRTKYAARKKSTSGWMK